jgi:putative NADPH-quinone reductase
MNQAPDYFSETRQEMLLATGDWEAPRRVLAIQASHRGTRGMTNTICRALVRGMEQAGAGVESVVLADLKFSPCRGCFKCWGKNWGGCCQEDGLTELIKSIPSYDLMLWAMPLYVDGMPGLLKNLVDRMMVLNHPAILEREGRCIHPCRHQTMPYLAVVTTCGFWGTQNFAPLLAHMDALAIDQHTPLLAFLQRPDSLSLMHPQGREAMVGVKEALVGAGKQLIERGSVDTKLRQKIAGPLLTRSQYFDLGLNWWKGS